MSQVMVAVSEASQALMVKNEAGSTLVITAQPIVYREQLPAEGILVKVSQFAEAGVLMYVMPSVPAGETVQAFMNGVEVDSQVSGVNVTLLGYSAGSIEATDELRFFYSE